MQSQNNRDEVFGLISDPKFNMLRLCITDSLQLVKIGPTGEYCPYIQPQVEEGNNAELGNDIKPSS